MHNIDGTRPLQGKQALVSGGSSGIGAATVRLLAAAGAQVHIGFHRGQARAEALCAELPGTGHQVLPLSLEDSAQHEALAQRLRTQLGHLDVLVNCAGFTQRVRHDDLQTMDAALFNRILLANAGGTFSLTRALLPLLADAGAGVVVNVSSVSAFTGAGSNVAYCAAKAAVDTMTLSLARAFGPAVRFLCVSPASVDTGFVPGRDRAELQHKALQTPLGRVVTPDDVALAVMACLTHLRTATGTRIVIDGGHTL